MAETIRRVEYYYVVVPDKPGSGAAVLGPLQQAGGNLMAYSVFRPAAVSRRSISFRRIRWRSSRRRRRPAWSSVAASAGFASHLKPQTPTPDLVVYLQAPVDTLIERVHRRGVDFERKISALYLTRLAEAYSRYFYAYEAAPLLIVNSERLNFVDNPEQARLLLTRIRAMRGRREFFNLAS